jgi:hypothetical protein
LRKFFGGLDIVAMRTGPSRLVVMKFVVIVVSCHLSVAGGTYPPAPSLEEGRGAQFGRWSLDYAMRRAKPRLQTAAETVLPRRVFRVG